MTLPHPSEWSPQSVAANLLGSEVALQELTAEVSPRRYFRPQAEPATSTRWLVVLSPDPAPIATTDFLNSYGIRVPQIGATTAGAYLVEDLGDRHLVHEPSLAHYQQLLQGWWDFAIRAKLPAKHPNLGLALNQALFERELAMFQQSYLLDYRSLQLTAGENLAVQEALLDLATFASAGPQCLQHRDFHSRNILLPDDGALAWIDHQDLRRGPLFYDLASLYTDAYVLLPDELFELLRAQVLPWGAHWGLDADQAMEHFLFTALQRVLKALGTFGKVIVNGRTDFAAAEQLARLFALALLDQLSAYPQLRKLLA